MNRWVVIVEILKMCGSRVKRIKSFDNPTVRGWERAHHEGQFIVLGGEEKRDSMKPSPLSGTWLSQRLLAMQIHNIALHVLYINSLKTSTNSSLKIILIHYVCYFLSPRNYQLCEISMQFKYLQKKEKYVPCTDFFLVL